MRLPRALGLALALCLLSACEKVDVEAEKENPDVEQLRPTSLGEGVQSSPYTVSQIIEGKATTGSTVWVIGYAVGSTYRTMSNALFTAETSYTSNILLANNSSCNATESCIAVELSTTAIQQALSLAYNPNHHRHCIMVCGQASRYFSQPGIRNVKDGYWLPNFDPSALNSSPTEWDEHEEQY